MSKPRSYQTEAIITKKTRLGEADRILTLYTPHLGKIQAVAKGVRRPRSKLSGHLELITHSLVSLARGRNLDTITGSQTIASFLPIKSDLDLSSCALYAIELVNQFTADHIENQRLFQLLLDTLECLCQGDNSELVLRYFELHLVGEVGYRPQLQQCVACHKPLEAIINSFSSGAGGVLCPGCKTGQPFGPPLSVNGLKVLRLMQDSSFNTIKRLKVSRELSGELEQIMRGYLKHLLEKEIKSVAWLDSLKQQG
jgi:DNA repair protein RecO (recombination protein O)